jgi:dihydroorotase
VTEFVLRGGRVIDPATGIDGRLDVHVRDGLVEAVLPPGAPSAARSEEVGDALVTPGFVDLHGHWNEASPWGIDPLINLRSGVTTPCDAGTSGYETFRAFRQRLATSPVRVLAFLHIGSLGCASMNAGELEDFRYVRVPDTIETIERNRDLIVGVKARLGSQPCGDNIMPALEAALEATAATSTPLMIHVSGGADLRRILPRLRTGDIVTHTFIADDGGLIFGGGPTILPEVVAAKERGVIFDVGHGCGSFDWSIYGRATEQGFRLDTISTDLHRLCVEGPVFDMLTTMSKFLHAGMPIPEIVAASSWRPAMAIRRQDRIGSLQPGRRADIAVFRVQAGSYDYVDAFGHVERASRQFVPVLTVNGGEIVRPEEISIELRPYTVSDAEIGCGAPLMSAAG